MIKKGITQPCFYTDVINKAKPFKSDTSKLVGSLKNLIRKGYDLATIVHFLRRVYFVRNIENNLLVQLICLTSNYIKTFIFHSIFDYYFKFNIWFQTIKWHIYSGLLRISVDVQLILEQPWSWSYGSWIYSYLCNQYLSSLKLWVRIPFMVRYTQYNIMW